jgi:hypothetical protein
MSRTCRIQFKLNSFKTRGGRERGKGCTTEPTQSSSAAWSIESKSALDIVLINLNHLTSLPFSARGCCDVSLPLVCRNMASRFPVAFQVSKVQTGRRFEKKQN